MSNLADLLTARADDEQVAILFEDQSMTQSITWAQYVSECSTRAAYLKANLPTGAPPHVGVLLDNVPEFPMWLGAAALIGAVVVGINPTRRGSELARDITHTDCQLIITETNYAPLLSDLDLGAANDRILTIDQPDYRDVLAPFRDEPLPEIGLNLSGDDTYLLLFTSGTSGAPKACLLSQTRLVASSTALVALQSLTADDVLYQCMPLFHSNAVITAFAPWLITGATAALRRKFSASGFLPDVRRFGATYFNYVGKPLSYILATPEAPDDTDNSLTRVFGNEAADRDITRFATRFGCTVMDGYGSTEGGATIIRTPDTPEGALGISGPGTVVIDPETNTECPRAQFDRTGNLLNAEQAIGEIVNRDGAAEFEGYYKNAEANAARIRSGWYWTGDLGYRDEAGFFYFAGRDFEWLRVDGENFSAAPLERILARHPDVVLAAIYAVPAEDVGDQVMAALELRPGHSMTPERLDTFLSEQSDLGTKWSPRYVRITDALPVTETKKILKRKLRQEYWAVTDPVWWRAKPGYALSEMQEADKAQLREVFVKADRLSSLAL